MLVNKFAVPSNGFSRVGQVVQAKYCNEVSFTGEVVDSRVKYGGEVQHSIMLAEHLVLPWCENAGYPCGTILIVNEDSITGVFV